MDQKWLGMPEVETPPVEPGPTREEAPEAYHASCGRPWSEHTVLLFMGMERDYFCPGITIIGG